MFRPRYHIDDKPSVLIIKLFIHVRNFLKIFEHIIIISLERN